MACKNHHKAYFLRSIFLLLVICFSLHIPAQNNEPEGYIPALDDTELTKNIEANNPPVYTSKPIDFPSPEFRTPPDEKIEKYRQDKRFQYDAKKVNAGWWERILEWLSDKINGVFRIPSAMGAMGYVFIVVLIIPVVLIIMKLAGVDFSTIIGRKKLDTPEIDIYSENVHEMDFDTLISNALKNKDYRLAVRFLYLKNLKALADKGFIKWDVNKTNTSYQYEIQDDNIRHEFLDTTFIFDYVWYGEFPIDEHDYSKAYNELDNFNKMLS